MERFYTKKAAVHPDMLSEVPQPVILITDDYGSALAGICLPPHLW